MRRGWKRKAVGGVMVVANGIRLETFEARSSAVPLDGRKAKEGEAATRLARTYERRKKAMIITVVSLFNERGGEQSRDVNSSR